MNVASFLFGTEAAVADEDFFAVKLLPVDSEGE
jgi:hypothetical protein